MSKIQTKTVDQVLGHMEEFLNKKHDTLMAAYSGFDERQWKAAQETTKHWLALLREAKDNA